MGKMIIIFISLVLTVSIARAQEPFTINGRVTDSSGTALSKATIRLSTGRDSILLTAGADGSFSIQITDRKFAIQVTMKGYNPYHRHFSVADELTSFTLPPILMATEYQELQTVTVLHYTPFTIKPDTLEYHAGAYSMREGSMLADLVKKLPGVRMTIDSNVFVMGKKVGKLLVDGKPFFSGDIQNALRNLPYDIIENIEIIDDWGDQARLTGVKRGEPEKVLNIVLKKDRRNGQFGSLEGGLGGSNQYSAIAVVNAFAGDRKFVLTGGLANNNPFGPDYGRFLRLSHTDQWGPAWLGSGDASLNGDDKTVQNSSTQESYFSGGHIHQQQDNIAHTHGNQEGFNYGWQYTSGLNTKLSINGSFNHQNSIETNQIGQSSTEMDSGFSKTTRSTTLNQYRNQATTAESRINFEHGISGGQSFSLDAGFKYSHNGQRGDNQNQIQTLTDSTSTQSLQYYLVNNENTLYDLNANLHYNLRLGDHSSWASNYSIHQGLSQSNRQWQEPDNNGNLKLVDSLSNDFNFRTLVQDLQTGYNVYSGKASLGLGLTAEPGSLNGSSPGKSGLQPYRYFNLLPMGSFSYILGKGQTVRLSYGKTIAPPTLQQVQPVTDLSNPQYPITGNSGLKPAASQTMGMNYDWSSSKPDKYWGFGVGIVYTGTIDMIVSNIVHPRDTSSVVQQTFFENVEGFHSLNVESRLDLPEFFHKQMKISLGGTFNEAHIISVSDGIPLSSDALTINQNLNFQYMIPDKVEVNAYFIYANSLTRYKEGGTPPTSASSITWGMNNHFTLFKDWDFRYEFMQTYNSGASPSLAAGPTILNLHLERSFLRKRQLSATVSVVNVMNANAGNIQTVTANPTTITQNHANFVGRSAFFSLRWKFERFPIKNSLIR
jgi:hypothetical protein